MSRGGLTLDQAAKQPTDLVNTFFFRASGGVPPREAFDIRSGKRNIPSLRCSACCRPGGSSYGHAKRIELTDTDMGFSQEDRRPAVVLDDVDAVELDHCKIANANGVKPLVMMKAANVSARNCQGLADFQGGSVPRAER